MKEINHQILTRKKLNVGQYTSIFPSDDDCGPVQYWDPVRLASLVENISALKELIEKKFPLNIRDKSGWSALMFGVENPDIFNLLFQNGADPDFTTVDIESVYTIAKKSLPDTEFEKHPVSSIANINGKYSITILD
jgi:ankyrin repeat protein